MVEFLQNLIFGVDYPGLKVALDPITIALMAQGLTSGVQGLVQRGRGKKLQQEGRDLFDKQVEDFRSGKYDLNLGQGVYDAYTNTQRLAEEAAQRTGEAGRSAISSAVANTRYGDPRTAFLTPKTAQTVMGGISDANVKAAQQQAEATMGLATTEQGIKTANETMRQQMESMLMARGAGQEQQGLQQVAEGANTAIGGFGDAFGAYAADPNSIFGPINRNQYVTDNNGNKAYRVRNFSLHNFDPSQMQNGYIQGYDPNAFFNRKTQQDGGRVPKYALGGMLDQIGGTMGDSLMEGGGVAPEILPGEFDHDSNPIHMVDDNGNKVAEATGGEILFNQNQSNNLIKLLQSGNPEALYAYLAELMQSPQFQMEVEEYNSELNG